MLDWANKIQLLATFPTLVDYMERMYKRPKAPMRIAAAFAVLVAVPNNLSTVLLEAISCNSTKLYCDCRLAVNQQSILAVISAKINVLNPDNPKKVVLIASNPTVSQQTDWQIGVWASELIHPYYEFTEHGYQVEIVSPGGGKLEIDSFSDPRDSSGYTLLTI